MLVQNKKTLFNSILGNRNVMGKGIKHMYYFYICFTFVPLENKSLSGGRNRNWRYDEVNHLGRGTVIVSPHHSKLGNKKFHCNSHVAAVHCEFHSFFRLVPYRKRTTIRWWSLAATGQDDLHENGLDKLN